MPNLYLDLVTGNRHLCSPCYSMESLKYRRRMGLRLGVQGFNPAEVPTAYGDTLTFWDWKQRKVTQTIKLGPDGLIPLELRFLHDPSQPHGFVGAALSSNVIHFTKVACYRACCVAGRCSFCLGADRQQQSRPYRDCSLQQ